MLTTFPCAVTANNKHTCKYKNKDVKPFTDFHLNFLERFLVAVGCFQLPARHPNSCSFNSPHHNRVGKKMERTGVRRITVWNKNTEITHKMLPNFWKYLAFKFSYFILTVVDCPVFKKTLSSLLKRWSAVCKFVTQTGKSVLVLSLLWCPNVIFYTFFFVEFLLEYERSTVFHVISAFSLRNWMSLTLRLANICQLWMGIKWIRVNRGDFSGFAEIWKCSSQVTWPQVQWLSHPHQKAPLMEPPNTHLAVF